MKIEEFDVLIVGAGFSGLRAGLKLSTQLNTAVINKVFPVRSHSGTAQGGIITVLGIIFRSHQKTSKSCQRVL